MVEIKLKTSFINGNDVLGALNNIFDDDVDCDFTGTNGEEFWTDYAKEQGKCEKKLVTEYIQEKMANHSYNEDEKIVDDYIGWYESAYGGYYDSIKYSFVNDNDRKIIGLAFAFARED